MTPTPPSSLHQEPLSGHVFCFFNRRRDRGKLLVWERDGCWLLYKRLETGTFAVLDRSGTGRSPTC